MKKYFFKKSGLLFVVSFLIMLSSIINVGLAFVAKSLMDLATADSSNDFVLTVVVAFGVILAMAIVNYLLSISKAKYIKHLMVSLKSDIFNKICALNITKFNDKNSAAYISILINDINVLEENYFRPVLFVISDTLVFGISVMALFKLNIYLAVVTMATGVIPLFIPKLTKTRLSLLRQEYSNNSAMFTSRIKDIFTGFEVLKSFNILKQIFHEYDRDNYIVENTRYKISVFEGVIEALSTLSGFSMFCITLACGVYLALQNYITIGSVIAATQLTNNVINPIVRMGYRMTAIKSTKPIIEKIDSLSVSEIETSKNINKQQFEHNIEFSNVSFSYDGKGKALHNINLEIEKGKKYAIVGHSGSGKSTILKLILNYYTDYSGEIRMDGIQISDLKPESLYAMVSIIHQNVFLFNTNLKENIALYQQYNEDTIQKAIQRSGLSELINSLEDRENTKIGEAGNKLSGGEKQRIAIARALVRNTPILLLDEATAALDNAMAYSIEKSILDLENITALVITHKLSRELLMQYDSILVLKNGELVEQGSFEQLMSNRKYFYSLYLVEEENVGIQLQQVESTAS